VLHFSVLFMFVVLLQLLLLQALPPPSTSMMLQLSATSPRTDVDVDTSVVVALVAGDETVVDEEQDANRGAGNVVELHADAAATVNVHGGGGGPHDVAGNDELSSA